MDNTTNPNHHTTTQTVEQVRNTQVVWTDWMKEACAGLEDHDLVEATRQHTPFGTYLLAIRPA